MTGNICEWICKALKGVDTACLVADGSAVVAVAWWNAETTDAEAD